MNFEPQKFFIGLIDFFSVLLPGGVLAYVLPRLDSVKRTFDLPEFDFASAAGWMVFVFLAYLLGHFVFLLGSRLDDWIYQPLRDATLAGQLRRLSVGKPLSSARLRRLAARRSLFGADADAAMLLATRLKARVLREASGAINAFQWSKAFLAREHPEGLAMVQRFEADSKFFRSFAVVLGLLALGFAADAAAARALACCALLALSLWRYVEQRYKATQQAYWLLLSANARAPLATQPLARADELTHAGGVVARRGTTGASEFLLVKASKGRDEWVLPKGHIEAGESPELAAVREVQEETGVFASIEAPLADIRLATDDAPPFVRFYRMQAVEHGAGSEARALLWLERDAAIARATHAETRELIARAAQAAQPEGVHTGRRS